MPDNNDRKFKVLGAGWLVLGAVAFAVAAVALLSVVLADDPDSAAFESGGMWWIVVLVSLVLAAVCTGSRVLSERTGVPASLPGCTPSDNRIVASSPSAVRRRAGGWRRWCSYAAGGAAQPVAHDVKTWKRGVCELHGTSERVDVRSFGFPLRLFRQPSSRSGRPGTGAGSTR